MADKLTFGIIGYGRFGRLWADCLRPFGRVLVYDKNPVTIAAGVEAATLAEAAAADIVFILVPISSFTASCGEISPLLRSHTIVVDACSVKEYPVRVMLESFAPDQPIIATHPLFGPDSVDRDGLAGKKIVVHPVRASAKQTASVEKILDMLSLKIIRATPEQHDRDMARSQALVHFIGRGLSTLNLTSQGIATPDYESLLNIQDMVTHDTWQLFLDMQQYNKYAKAVRRDFLANLGHIELQLDSESHA
jgi:prephenate dehydrogenase